MYLGNTHTLKFSTNVKFCIQFLSVSARWGQCQLYFDRVDQTEPKTPNDEASFFSYCFVVSQCKCLGTFTLNGNGTGTGTGNWTSRIETMYHGPFPCLRPVWTFLYNMRAHWFQSHSLQPVPIPFACSVNSYNILIAISHSGVAFDMNSVDVNKP